MKAVVIDGVDTLAIRDVPDGGMGDYLARTRLVIGSICNSTDSKLLYGTFPGCTNFPAVLGHEAIGEVVEVGSKVRNYKLGDLVIRPKIRFPEGTDIREYFGSFAETGYVTDQWARMEDDTSIEPGPFGHPQQVIPSGVDPAVGVISITLKETLSWTQRFGIGPKTSVLVFGTGPVGVAFVMFAKQLGAKTVILAGRTTSSIERAAAICGPTHTIKVNKPNFSDVVVEMNGGVGIDRVIEGVGDNSIIDMGIACLSPEGRIGIYGVPPNTDSDALHQNDPHVVYLSPDESEVHEEFFDMVKSGEIDPYLFTSHRMGFDEISKGFRLLKERQAFKVLLDW